MDALSNGSKYRIGLVLMFLLGLGVLFTEAAAAVGRISGLSSIYPALAIHILILGVFLLSSPTLEAPKPQLINDRLWDQLKKRPYLPHLLFTVGCLGVVIMLWGPIYEIPPLSSLIRLSVMVLFVPVVEELVYRGLLGSFLVKKIGTGWGIYSSSILFSWMHTYPTLERLVDLQVGLAFGPLLLGLCCEILVRVTGSLKPAIVLHVLANGTIPVFQIFAPEALRSLSWFYG